MYSFDECKRIENELINQIQLNSCELLALQEEVNSVYEDLIYRFYHQSFKVYYLNEYTLKILTYLKMLMPNYALNEMFINIVYEGLKHEFSLEVNKNWTVETNPVVYAFYQSKHMLDMVVKYGIKYRGNTEGCLFSGWASVLYLYNIR